jgi:hypothetical protein
MATTPPRWFGAGEQSPLKRLIVLDKIFSCNGRLLRAGERHPRNDKPKKRATFWVARWFYLLFLIRLPSHTLANFSSQLFDLIRALLAVG